MAHKKYKGMNSTNLFPQPSHTLCRPQILFWGFSKICRHDVDPISMARFCRRYGDGFHHFRCRHDRRLWRYYRRLLTARDVLLGGESDQLVEGLGIRGLDLFLAAADLQGQLEPDEQLEQQQHKWEQQHEWTTQDPHQWVCRKSWSAFEGFRFWLPLTEQHQRIPYSGKTWSQRFPVRRCSKIRFRLRRRDVQLFRDSV